MADGLYGLGGARLYLEATGRLARALERGAITAREYRECLDAMHGWLAEHNVHVATGPDPPAPVARVHAGVSLYCRAKGRLDLARRSGAISECGYRRRLESVHEWLRDRGVRVTSTSAG